MDSRFSTLAIIFLAVVASVSGQAPAVTPTASKTSPAPEASGPTTSTPTAPATSPMTSQAPATTVSAPTTAPTTSTLAPAASPSGQVSTPAVSPSVATAPASSPSGDDTTTPVPTPADDSAMSPNDDVAEGPMGSGVPVMSPPEPFLPDDSGPAQAPDSDAASDAAATKVSILGALTVAITASFLF